jgi:integrase
MNELIPYITPQYRIEVNRDPHLKSAHSRRQYISALDDFERWRGDRPVARTLVEEYVSLMQSEGLAPSTIKVHVAAVKWWVRRVRDLAEETRPREEADEIARQAERIADIRAGDVAKGTRPPAGRHIPDEEFALLIEAARRDPTPIGARDAAFLAVAIPTGARNEELRSILLSDMRYDGDGVIVTIRHGKGDRAREVFLLGNALRAVNAWLDERGANPGYLFCRIFKGGKIAEGDQLSYSGTRKMLHTRFVQAGLERRISWHDFRRTLVGNMLSNGEDYSTIQSQTGHQSIETVKRYDQRPQELRRRAIEKINVPF